MFTTAVPDYDVDSADLVVFASPDPRCVFVANEFGSFVSRLCIVGFADYVNPVGSLSVIDTSLVRKYEDNYQRLVEVGGARAHGYSARSGALNYLQPFKELLSEEPDGRTIIVDISTAPRGHLFTALLWLKNLQLAAPRRVILAYTQVSSHSVDEESYSYGMQDVSVVPGFEGSIKMRRDLLVIALGFEGNRAYSLYRRVVPGRTELLIGDSEDDQSSFYVETAKRNNHSLLHIHGNRATLAPSRDAEAFSRVLASKFQEFCSDDMYNVYYSCLGTKAQVVGSFLALRDFPQVQVLDALPTRRRSASGAAVQVLFDDFGFDRLARHA